MESLSDVFIITELRPFMIKEIQIISNGITRKQYSLAAKYNITDPDPIFSKLYEDFYTGAKNDDLDDFNFTKNSEITLNIYQFQAVGSVYLDVIDVYVVLEYIGDCFDQVFDADTGSIRISLSTESSNIVYTDNSSYAGGSAWESTSPVNLQQAVTRLANAVAALLGNQIPE
jgi:hypothetical protein